MSTRAIQYLKQKKIPFEVIRYEQLDDGLRKVCERIGTEFDPDRLPTFKKGLRDDKVGLSEIYTSRAIEVIANLYDYELERFGYEPPELS